MNRFVTSALVSIALVVPRITIERHRGWGFHTGESDSVCAVDLGRVIHGKGVVVCLSSCWLGHTHSTRTFRARTGRFTLVFCSAMWQYYQGCTWLPILVGMMVLQLEHPPYSDLLQGRRRLPTRCTGMPHLPSYTCTAPPTSDSSLIPLTYR